MAARRPLLAACAASLWLTACAGLAGSEVAAGFEGVTVDGRVALARRYVLAAAGYTASDVQLVRVYLKRGSGTEALLGSLAGPNQPIVIRNLRRATTYTVRLAAYADANGNTAIDSNDSGCLTTFTTSNNTRMEQTFQLKLQDVSSGASANLDIEVTAGSVTDASSSLGLETQ